MLFVYIVGSVSLINFGVPSESGIVQMAVIKLIHSKCLKYYGKLKINVLHTK